MYTTETHSSGTNFKYYTRSVDASMHINSLVQIHQNDTNSCAAHGKCDPVEQKLQILVILVSIWWDVMAMRVGGI